MSMSLLPAYYEIILAWLTVGATIRAFNCSRDKYGLFRSLAQYPNFGVVESNVLLNMNGALEADMAGCPTIGSSPDSAHTLNELYFIILSPFVCIN